MKRFRMVLAALSLLLLFGTFGVQAAYDTDYTIDGNEQIAIPQAYRYLYSINVLQGIGEDTRAYFDQPSDLRMDQEGNLYVADTKNNRVVKMDQNGRLISLYEEAGGTAFNQPQGVWPGENGEVYIADTGNQRIVCLAADGTLLREYGLPDSPVLSEVQVYSPTKIALSPTGGLYVLMGETIMSVDEENTFRGYIGQTDIGFNFVDWLLRIVASEEQKVMIGKRTAASYVNFTVNGEGLIYATSQDEVEGQIKVLNSVGNNIYKKLSDINKSGFSKFMDQYFSGNVIGKPFRYGELVNGENPVFSGIAVDRNGMVTVVERQTGKLYQYDQTGNLLAVFGGLGSDKGEFTLPAALVVDDKGLLYVLDSSKGNIQVFEPTAFIQKVQQATVLYNDGDYDGASVLWNEVLAMDGTYPLAHIGLASTAYKEGDWEASMEGYRYANDRSQYAKAFSEYRYDFMQRYFPWVVLGIVAIVAAAGVLVVQASRRSRRVLQAFEYRQIPRLGIKNGLLMGTSILFRPRRVMESIKNSRGRLNVPAGMLILLLALLARLFFIYTVSYSFQDVELEDVNLLLEAAKILLPFFTWVGASYLLSSQFNGETTLEENFVAASYCMIPYVVVEIAAALLSHVLCVSERSLFAVLVNGVVLWMLWLFIRSIFILNDYGVGRTVFVCLLSVCAMVLIWFVALLGYTLVGRIIQFIEELVQEASLLI